MRIAVTGSKGQLGSALLSQFATDTLMGVDLPEHDITQLDAIAREMERFAPDIIIHAAAMTDVDGCERNPELAFRVNALGTRNLAIAAQRCDAAPWSTSAPTMSLMARVMNPTGSTTR